MPPREAARPRATEIRRLAAAPRSRTATTSSGYRGCHRLTGLFNLKHRFKVEIEEAPERNVHGFKGYRLKQEQMALAVLLALPANE